MCPWILRAWSRTSGRVGEVTSRVSQCPPREVMEVTGEGVEDGEREVAITLCPAERARRVRPSPKLLEQPVMNQTDIFGEDIGIESGFYRR